MYSKGSSNATSTFKNRSDPNALREGDLQAWQFSARRASEQEEPALVLLEIWKNGKLGGMKTTLEISDDLFRAAKAKAALEGIKLKELVDRGLKREVYGEAAVGLERQRVKFPLLKSRRKAALAIPDDAAFQADLLDDKARHEASLR